MDRRGHRLVLPEDGYEWKKYGQKFIKSIRKFRSYFKCQESSCMAKKQAEWCTSDPTNVRIVYDGVHSHTHHGSSSSSADQPKRESPKDESPSEKAKKEYSKLPSNPEEVEDLRRDSAANPLIAFTYDELRIITANFRQDRVLGGGGFGCVYKGFISEDLREGLQPVPVAVKVHDGDNSYQGHREWLAEVIFLGHLSHPNLVKLIGYCCEDEHRVLIYEFMARGSVENNLFSKVLLPLPWSIRMKIAFGAAKGLAFLHEAEKPVIYRDFKTSNILLDTVRTSKMLHVFLRKGLTCIRFHRIDI